MWYLKASILRQQKKYKDSTRAFNKSIELNKNNTKSYVDLASMYLVLGDLEHASSTIKKVPKEIENNPEILSIHGKIELQNQKYPEALELFEKAVHNDLGNVEHLGWKAYAKFLYSDSNTKPKDWEYNYNIISILRTLEKACSLMKEEKSEDSSNSWIPVPKRKISSSINNLKSEVLYFKGYCYFKLGDYGAAYDKFYKSVKCATTDDNRQRDALLKKRDALVNVWKNNIRPPIWQWWWNDPVKKLPKRIVSLAILIMISGIVFFHQFIPIVSNKILLFFKPDVLIENVNADFTMYIVFLIALIISLLLPQIERIKSSDFEIELYPPSSLGLSLPHIQLENTLADKASYEKFTSLEQVEREKVS